MNTAPARANAPMTCLILGAKGFVGTAIVAEAERRGHSVLPVDVDEYEAAKGSRCDVLINANGNSKKYLAAQDPAGEFDLSVRSVARSLQDFRPARYVHLSTVDVYNDHADPKRNAETAGIAVTLLSPYGFHKFMAEQLVQFYAPSWLIFRMAGFVGRGLKKNSIHDLLTGKPLRVHPDSAYQYMNKRDLAAIVFDMIEQGTQREIVNVAGDGLITLREVAGLIPGCELRSVTADLPVERYDISIAKLKALRPVPRTQDTVRQFVHEVLTGVEVLA